MYVGRIVAVGLTKINKLVAMYRVSSRSFPNRQAIVMGNIVTIMPKEGFKLDIHKNPYIVYNCLRTTKACAIVGNGTHTDPIAEKLETGMNMRDALVSALHGMDYEHDELNTPRIAVIADIKSRKAALGIIRQDAIMVEAFKLESGCARYVATYEHNSIGKDYKDDNFNSDTVDDACRYILKEGVFAQLERPITAVCAIESGSAFEVGIKNTKIS